MKTPKKKSKKNSKLRFHIFPGAHAANTLNAGASQQIEAKIGQETEMEWFHPPSKQAAGSLCTRTLPEPSSNSSTKISKT